MKLPVFFKRGKHSFVVLIDFRNLQWCDLDPYVEINFLCIGS
jgi:hypothetical protein